MSGGKHIILRVYVVLVFFSPQDSETNRGEYEKKRNTRDLSREISEDSDVFGM